MNPALSHDDLEGRVLQEGISNPAHDEGRFYKEGIEPCAISPMRSGTLDHRESHES